MPSKLLWVSMTTELWCLVAGELALNCAAVLLWIRQRRVPRANTPRACLAVAAAVPFAAILAFGAGALRAFFPASGPPSETARDLAIGILTMLHAAWLWMPFLVVPAVAYGRVQALAGKAA